MYRLLHGPMNDSANTKFIGEYVYPRDICRDIASELEAKGVDSRYLRLLGSGSSIYVDYGSYTEFYKIEGVKVKFYQFVNEFYGKGDLCMGMTEFKIKLNGVEDVKEFVQIATGVDFSIDIAAIKQRYIVDGKSIMGILSLDLSKVIRVECHTDIHSAEEFKQRALKFVVE